MSDLRYFDLSTPARYRLAMMRRDFESHAKRYPNCPEHAKPASWRAVRAYTLGNYRAAFCAGLNPGFNGEGFGRSQVWYSHSGPNFREETAIHERRDVWNARHTGYYTDAGGSETAWGIVARLPHGRFIAGYEWGETGERVYFPQVYTEESEACRAADSHAERFADDCREDSHKSRECAELEREREDKAIDLGALFALRNHHRFPNARDDVRELIETIRAIDARLQFEFSAYR